MFHLNRTIMEKKQQIDVPEKNVQTQQNRSFWERNAFLFGVRAGFGVIFGLLFFIGAMFFSLQMEERFNTDPVSRVELMVIFVVLMHLMTYWFWFYVLDKWTANTTGYWLVISVFAFLVFVLTGAITLAVFVSYACDFFMGNYDQWWRVLPILCVIASIGRMIYKIKKQDPEKE